MRVPQKLQIHAGQRRAHQRSRFRGELRRNRVDYESGEVFEVEMHDGSNCVCVTPRRRLRSNQQVERGAHADGGASQRRDSDRSVLHQHAETDVYRSVEPRRSAFGTASGVVDPAAEVGARQPNGEPAVETRNDQQ